MLKWKLTSEWKSQEENKKFYNVYENVTKWYHLGDKWAWRESFVHEWEAIDWIDAKNDEAPQPPKYFTKSGREVTYD